MKTSVATDDMASEGWGAYQVGLQFAWPFLIAADHMEAFALLCGDRNPIHFDAEFARAKGFRDPVVHGMLLAAQVSRLIGEELPDQNCMLLSSSLTFAQPAFLSDKLVFEAEITKLADSVKLITFKCRILRSSQLLCRGSVEALWRA